MSCEYCGTGFSATDESRSCSQCGAPRKRIVQPAHRTRFWEQYVQPSYLSMAYPTFQVGTAYYQTSRGNW